MLHAGWRGLGGGRARARAWPRCATLSDGRADRMPCSAPARAPAATRSARRSTRRSAPAPPSAADGRPARDRPRAPARRGRRPRSRSVGGCTICDERFFSHRREGERGRAPGGGRVVELIRGLRRRARGREPEPVARRSRGRRSPTGALARAATVRILAATKYVPDEELPALAEAGVELVGENRAQDLERKVAAHGALFEWHFIGQLQSRKVRLIVPHVSLIHSVASRVGARASSRATRDRARPGLRDPARGQRGRRGGQGGHRARGDRRLHRGSRPLPVAGLMTMPPLAARPGGRAAPGSPRCASSRPSTA